MKFKYINIKNLKHLVPYWAINPIQLGRKLDEMFDQDHSYAKKNWKKTLDFWIELDLQNEKANIRFCIPDNNADNSGQFIIKCRSYANQPCQIEFSINAIIKGYPSIENQYTVYFHCFQTEVPLTYIGMTQKPWYERFSQHLSAAKSGSNLIFHKALIDHQTDPVLHRVYLYGLDKDTAEDIEEKSVGNWALYPLGLNMIPGGKAGLKYLYKLGLHDIDQERLPFVLQEISRSQTINGQPNPLCAARWANDNDFVERVICGHSGRLSVEQVRQIRLLMTFEIGKEKIMEIIGIDNQKQISNLINNKTYNRIK